MKTLEKAIYLLLGAMTGAYLSVLIASLILLAQ